MCKHLNMLYLTRVTHGLTLAHAKTKQKKKTKTEAIILLLKKKKKHSLWNDFASVCNQL